MAQLDDRDQLARRVADLQKQEEKLVLRSGQRVQQAPGGGATGEGGFVGQDAGRGRLAA
jgi:hypothetical protein